MTDPNPSKQAVILSGGGADGAYEIGVMKALFSGQSPATGFEPLDPQIISGTSIGSYNAAFLVAQWETHGPAAIANLEQIWLNRLSYSAQRCGHGVFRLRADPTEFINPMCFIPNPLQPFIQLAVDSADLTWNGLQRAVNFVTAEERSLLERFVELFDFSIFVASEPMQQTLYETIQFADIRSSEKALRIAGTNWATGMLRIFDNQDMTDQLGPLIIMASSAIPGFFRPVQVDGQPFVDGGVLMNTPLKPAIDAGADILHVIYMDPDIKDIPLGRIENTLETMYRMQTIGWAKTVNNDLTIAKHVNYEVAFAKLVGEAIEILKLRAPDEDLFIRGIRLRDIEQRLKKSADHRPLTIHVYHPRDDLSGALGLLNFDRERIHYLIQRGFNDATAYESETYELVRPFHPPELSAQLARSE